jgi:hypothetical protein
MSPFQYLGKVQIDLTSSEKWLGLGVRRLLNPKVRFSMGLSDGGRVMVEVRITSR